MPDQLKTEFAISRQQIAWGSVGPAGRDPNPISLWKHSSQHSDAVLCWGGAGSAGGMRTWQHCGWVQIEGGSHHSSNGRNRLQEPGENTLAALHLYIIWLMDIILKWDCTLAYQVWCKYLWNWCHQDAQPPREERLLMCVSPVYFCSKHSWKYFTSHLFYYILS